MYNPHKDQFKEYCGGRHPPSLPISGTIHQWPGPQLASNETYYYSTSVSTVPVNALVHVPSVMAPSVPDNDSLVMPVIVSRSFNVPPPGFPTKTEYLAQSHQAWTEPYVAEPSTTHHTFSPDAPEFVPSSRQTYEPQQLYHVTSAEKHPAVPSASGNHYNVQTQSQYQMNTHNHHQGGYYSHQGNQFSATHSGSQLHRHNNTYLGSYDQKRAQEHTNADGMTKAKRDTNKGASKRPPWSNVPQTQVKEAPAMPSQPSTQPLSCMPSIHSRDESSPAQGAGNKMFNMNQQNQDIYDTRSDKKSYRFPAHRENGQYLNPSNSQTGVPFKKYNKPHGSSNHPQGYYNQGDHYSYNGSYPNYAYYHNASPKDHYHSFGPQTLEFTNRLRCHRMPQQAWAQHPNNIHSANRGKRYNHRVETEAREPYYSDRRRYRDNNNAEFNPKHFEDELHRNNHRQQYPKQNWQPSQGVSRMEDEFFNSRSRHRQTSISGSESQVLDSESLNETSSSNDVEPDDDIISLDSDYDKSQAPAQDAESNAELSSDPGLPVIPIDAPPVPSKVEPSSISDPGLPEIPIDSPPMPRKVEPSNIIDPGLTEIPMNYPTVPSKVGPTNISDNGDLQAAKSSEPLEKTGDPATEATEKPDHNKDVENNFLLAEVPDKVAQVESTLDIKKVQVPDIEPKTAIDKVTVTHKVPLKKQDSSGQHGDKPKYEGPRNQSDSKRTENSQRPADSNFDRPKWQNKGHDKSGQHRGRQQTYASESMPKLIQRNSAIDTNRMYGAGRQSADRSGNEGRVGVQRSNSDSYSNVLKGNRTVHSSSRDTAKVQLESRVNLEEKMSKNKMIARQTSVLLDDYNSDLNLIVDAGGYGAFTVDTPLGFSKLWADCKATHGVNKGKSYFEVKLMDLIEESMPEENDQRPNVLRIGWSAENAVFEANTGSWSFGYKDSRDTIKGEAFCETTAKDDVLAAMVNFDVDPVEISYLKNGEAIGQTALFTPSLKNSALFPHISLKNCKVRVNFGQRESPWYPPPEGFSFIGKSAVTELSPSLTPPVKKSDCELIMMIGLPGSGKTTWASQRQEEHRDRRYNILGTDLLVELMRASNNGLQGSEMDKDLYPLAEGCYRRLLTISSMKARNYILDEVNVQASTRAEKLRKFHPFSRRAVIVQPSQRDLEQRREKLSTAGRNVPENELKEMEASFTLPDRSEEFKFIDFVGLKEHDAKKLIEKYQGSSHGKSPMLALD